MASKFTLNLDQLVDRPVVIIGADEYRLYTTDLLPPLDNYRVKKLVKRIDEIALHPDGTTRLDLSDAELDELAGPVVKKNGKPVKDADGHEVRRGGLLDKAVRIVLEAPADIHERITDRQRVEILSTFYMPSWLLPTVATASEAATTTSPTGETSPAGSPASIQAAATP